MPGNGPLTHAGIDEDTSQVLASIVAIYIARHNRRTTTRVSTGKAKAKKREMRALSKRGVKGKKGRKRNHDRRGTYVGGSFDLARFRKFLKTIVR